MTTLRISFCSEDELDVKLALIMRHRGYHVERPPTEMITVKELARRVGRSNGSVSRSLHRPMCPSFHAIRGKRRILKLEPNARLLAWLAAD